MTEEQLDAQVLITVASLIVTDKDAANLMQKLWSDRAHLIQELEAIELWDMTHAEALTVDHVLRMVRGALEQHRLG